jgi:hypothetical protein
MHRLQTALNTKKDGKFAMQSGNLRSSIQVADQIIQRRLRSSAMVSNLSTTFETPPTVGSARQKGLAPSTPVSKSPPLPSYPECDD